MVEQELTEDVIAGFRDKISKDPKFVEIFRRHDYLTAYSMNTDCRVDDNPIGAIGRADEWDSHGYLQLAFMLDQGLTANHTLLDMGCGCGRAARRFVPFLEDGNYTGMDISEKALAYAREISESEGWDAKHPTFLINSDIDMDSVFDFIWGHSVFTHLPPEQIEKMIFNASQRFVEKFAFTYKYADEPQRSGLKQFQYPFEHFASVAEEYGLRAENHPARWPAGQRTVVLTHQ